MNTYRHNNEQTKTHTMKKVFYLFGQHLSRIYHNNSFLDVLEEAKKFGEFETAVFDPAVDHPSQLLLEFDGWGGFAEITEKEYKKLRKVKDEEK